MLKTLFPTLFIFLGFIISLIGSESKAGESYIENNNHSSQEDSLINKDSLSSNDTDSFCEDDYNSSSEDIKNFKFGDAPPALRVITDSVVIHPNFDNNDSQNYTAGIGSTLNLRAIKSSYNLATPTLNNNPSLKEGDNNENLYELNPLWKDFAAIGEEYVSSSSEKEDATGCKDKPNEKKVESDFQVKNKILAVKSKEKSEKNSELKENPISKSNNYRNKIIILSTGIFTTATGVISSSLLKKRERKKVKKTKKSKSSV